MDITQVLLARPDVLDSEDKLNRVLADVYGSDASRINRLMRAYNVGVFKSILQGRNTEFEKQRLVDRLVDVHDMKPLMAWAAVNEWYGMVTPQVLEAYEKYRSYPVSKVYLSGDTEAIISQMEQMAVSLKNSGRRSYSNHIELQTLLEDLTGHLARLQREARWMNLLIILEGVAIALLSWGRGL